MFLRNVYTKLPLVRDLIRLQTLLREIRDEVRSGNRLQSAANAMMATQIMELGLEKHPRYGDPKRLLKHGRQVCSQNGEDGMIQEVFRRIGVTNRSFIEIGIGDGGENNTAFLLAQGWSGTWIEASETAVKSITSGPHAHLVKEGKLKVRQAFVTRENIQGILSEMKAPVEADLLSLDIDQNTYHVLSVLGNLRPRVLVVEYNPALPPDVVWVCQYDANRVWDGTINYGASLKAYEILCGQMGYSLVGCDFTGANAFFVRSDALNDHFCAPFTAENHYEPPRYGFVRRYGHRESMLDVASS